MYRPRYKILTVLSLCVQTARRKWRERARILKKVQLNSSLFSSSSKLEDNKTRGVQRHPIRSNNNNRSPNYSLLMCMTSSLFLPQADLKQPLPSSCSLQASHKRGSSRKVATLSIRDKAQRDRERSLWARDRTPGDILVKLYSTHSWEAEVKTAVSMIVKKELMLMEMST
jgi:hypothetical protein